MTEGLLTRGHDGRLPFRRRARPILTPSGKKDAEKNWLPTLLGTHLHSGSTRLFLADLWNSSELRSQWQDFAPRLAFWVGLEREVTGKRRRHGFQADEAGEEDTL